ncbi:glucan endo-1,3-beta-glucosidase-like [Tasmannia lanceolata]|uniref:glucan endo-1,3-beta-glucosidase-like n=1 Tax=Tasmannia lanceolata TaxID=3420 RepID=UPI0040628AFE
MATSNPNLSILPLLLAFLFLGGSHHALAIGVNYGTLGDNLPPPATVAAFLKQHTIIDRVKIFNTDPAILTAFKNTGISVTVTIGNGDIPSLAKLPAARDWVSTHISPFYPSTQITRIAVGNEITATGDKNLLGHLLPAMKTLYSALKLAGISNIQVSTPHTLGILTNSEPPSNARFRPVFDKVIFGPMLEFLRETKSPFMVNPYPYFGGLSENSINYALFKPNPGVLDSNTGIRYTNMFDAMLDSVYSAMKRMGYGDVEICVAETGWPSVGDANQPFVTMENAISYNGNLLKHVSSGKGTPLMPNRRFETFLFALFNENQKPGSTAERNFGLFRPDLTPVYDVGIMRGGQAGGHTPSPSVSGKKWCVAKPGISVQALQSNIDYVCSKGLDCKPIQSGGACFQPDTIQSHAAYAMNAYYQSSGRHDYDCYFSQTGLVTSSDPSYGTCRYSS